MKKILTAIMLFSTLKVANAQIDTSDLKLPIKSNKIVYEGVVEVQNRSKNDLFFNAKKWGFDFLKFPDNPVQNEDREMGRLLLRGNTITQLPNSFGESNVGLRMTIQIDVKENKFRYKIYDLYFTSANTNSVNTSGSSSMCISMESFIDIAPKIPILFLSKKHFKQLFENANFEILSGIAHLKNDMKKPPDDF
jgi:hypothetical protein